MKKLLLILATLFSLNCYSQQAGINLNYYPQDVFDIENLNLEANYYFGSDYARFGGFVRTDDDFKDFSCGVGVETTFLKLGESADCILHTAIGFDGDRANDDRFGDDFHKNFYEISLQVAYKVTDLVSLKQSYTKQYYNQSGLTYVSVGAIYKIK